jgi:hypothetical protein
MLTASTTKEAKMSKRITTMLSVLALALAAAPAYASAQSLRSPDGTDGAVMVQPASGTSLQSPDAQDSAHSTAAANNPAPVQARADDGSDWVLPVAGALAAVALAFGVALVASRRKHHAVSA